MKIKNSKGASIESSIATSMMAVLPNFDEPARELQSLGLTEDMIKRVKNGYETGKPIKKGG
ncbi:MAG: hypothetical protein RR280_04410 [Bacteroidaceae bacterium]